MADLRARIEELWQRRDEVPPDDSEAVAAVHEAIDLLDRGEARVAEVVDGEVVVHEWLKQAVLLLFRQARMVTHELGPFEFADKIPLKSGYEAAGVRVVPGASARWGSFLERGVILMPSYVNIGARVGARTMVDTWATVGSCAQIGADVHLSGGVGIGGVLEPPQASPVVVEDGAFIGSRSMVTERTLALDSFASGETCSGRTTSSAPAADEGNGVPGGSTRTRTAPACENRATGPAVSCRSTRPSVPCGSRLGIRPRLMMTSCPGPSSCCWYACCGGGGKPGGWLV